MEISFNKVIKNYGFGNVLNEFNLEVNKGDKVALVGSNGSGKSTILKIINGLEKITSGSFTTRKNLKTVYLNQILDEYDGIVFDFIRKEFKELNEVEHKIKTIEKKIINNKGDIEQNVKIYSNLQERFLKLGGYEIEETINNICKDFNINEEMLKREYNNLSGGEKTLISLASLMISEPDVLLLDEPTNHLDIKTLEFLEDFIITSDKTIIISSHDRYFLDKVVKKIVLIESGKEEIFHGNYSYYIDEKEKRDLNEFNDYKVQQKQIKAMEEAIKKLRTWGRLSDNPAFFKRANNIEQRLLKMEKIKKKKDLKNLPIEFSIENRSAKNVLNVQKLTIEYDKIILDNVSFEIKYKDRVCLMGNNGTGKSSLIKKILEDGNFGSNVKVSYIPQIIEFEDENITVYDLARKYSDKEESILRSYLTKFYFNDELIFKRLKVLSGGEKVRLKLFCLIQEKSNFLIFDEPTNHIDIDTKELLEDAIKNFEGTVLFVSHDRYFINKLADYILNIEDKKIVKYYGNYDYFKSKKK